MKKFITQLSRLVLITLLFSISSNLLKAETGTLTVNAGADISLVLPQNSTSFSAIANSTGNITGYNWVKLAGPIVYSLSNENTSTLTISNLVEGYYSFVVTVSDDLSNVQSDTVNVTVSTRILIDFGSTTTSSPDINNNYWNNVISANNGVKLTSSVTTNNILNSLGFEVVNRIDGTFNIAGFGVNTANTTGSVGDYPNSATADYAFAHNSGTNGKWKLTGLDSGSVYTVKFWGSRTGDLSSKEIEIKREVESVYQSYEAQGNTDFNRAAVFVFSGTSEMIFDIRVKSGSTFGYIGLIDIMKYDSTNSPNISPIAIAGPDVSLILPTNSTTVSGASSTDPDGTIIAYNWRKIQGPQNFNIVSPNAATTVINNLVSGIYQFELTVTDNNGAIDSDTIMIQVGSRILFDFGRSTVTTASPDVNSNYWNNVTSGTNGVKISDAINTNNAATGISMEVINRIDGTFNVSGLGVNTNTEFPTGVGAIGDYVASATADYAFAHPSATNGQWKFSGLDSLKTYSFKFWGTKAINVPRVIEIKTSESSTWKSYDATNNADFNRAATFLITGKTEQVFDIRVQTASSFGYISVVDINYTTTCRPTTSTTTITACGSYEWNENLYTASGTYNFISTNVTGCDSTQTLNLTIINPPVVDAGADQVITNTSSATLAGVVTGSYSNATWTGGTGTFTPNNTTLNAVYTPSASEVLAGSVDLTLEANNATCGLVSNSVTLFITNTTPVTLLSFKGAKTKIGNELTWSTSTEINNNGFEILRSNDGQSFTKIGYVVSKALNGNSSNVLNYNFVDNTTLGQAKYYRLNQLGSDNRNQFSSIVFIKGENANTFSLNFVSPNPAQNFVNVNIASTVKENVSLMVYDATGKNVLSQNASLVSGNNNIKINVNKLSFGNYFIKISGSNQIVASFIKN
jgi:hypothetical protein